MRKQTQGNKPTTMNPSPKASVKEARFYRSLRDVFVGAEVEGESGYINLMAIKSRYYEDGVFLRLKQDVEEALQPFPDFREELFDKLYTFFSRYFSESGSIYFSFTPLHQSVYERVYTDDKDVMLFWKTHMLYYVKTDRLFRNLEVELDGFKFFFDVSTLEHKRAMEKREIVHEFKTKRKDGTLVFDVSYSERGKKTRMDQILRECRKQGVKVSEDTLERAFQVFAKQSEVDYFINKNAKAFLQEQFNLWLYQYVFAGESEWTETRIRQLQTLKDIAFKIIDFISQFEDELVKIWNKPKFVLNSNYVITLDRIAERDMGLMERILCHPNWPQQVQEWRDLGIVDEDLRAEDILLPEQPVQSDLFSLAQQRGLITTGYHLPYNPKLVEPARELRKNMTPAEKQLWYGFLRGFKYPVLRQRPIDHYIVDFYCAQLKLVIEIDGESHFTEEGKAYDEERTRILEGYGLRVLRFTNNDVLRNFEGVCQQIEAQSPLSPLTKGTTQSPLSPLTKGGEGGMNPKYCYLPIDTRYFKDLELEILGLFENLDQALDGWLIKSENYQALNTILPKFREKVQTIYIDPPFNKGKDADYYYSVKYKDASWLTLLENRLRLGRNLLSDDGSIFVRCNYEGNMFVKLLMDYVFGLDNFRNEIIVRRAEEAKGEFVKQFPMMKSMTVNYDNLYWYSRNADTRFEKITKPIPEKRGRAHWHSFWKAEDRPHLRYEILGIDLEKHGYGQWMWSPERAFAAVENYRRYLEEARGTGESLEEYWFRTGRKFEFVKREGDGISSIKYWIPPRRSVIADNNWLDIKGYANKWGFKTENSEPLLKRVIENLTDQGRFVLDFFLGSGTTTAVAHKLKKKWIGVEVGEHFYSFRDNKGILGGVLVRMKEVLAGKGNHEPSGISKEVNWQGGGFFKYYELEQYEDALRRAKYEDADLFDDPYRDPYNQYVFLRDLKMLEALEVDLERNKVQVDLNKLYPPSDSPLNKGGIKGGIDIAETLSNLRGKWIKRITPDPSDPLRASSVEFEDGEKVDIKNLDYRLIKPLIWW